MFDDQPSAQPMPPINLPHEADDMFSEVEQAMNGSEKMDASQNALAAGLLKKKPAPASMMGSAGEVTEEANGEAPVAAPITYDTKAPILGKIIFNGKASIGHGCKLSIENNGILEIGKNLTISAETSIICHKGIKIGNDCLFSWDVL